MWPRLVPTYNSSVSLQKLALQAYKTVPAWHYKVWCGEPHCNPSISFIVRSSSHLELYNKFRGGLRTLVSPCLRKPSGWEWRAIIERLPVCLPPSIAPLPRQKTEIRLSRTYFPQCWSWNILGPILALTLVLTCPYILFYRICFVKHCFKILREMCLT